MLEKINKANDIKQIAPEDMTRLAGEIRDYLIGTVSHTGGHLASNLGAVELTLALHSVCTLPRDKIIWDVGHQCYTHKILTGRKEELKQLRQEGGISGFPRREESDCDSFDGGHSSNSVSAGLGYVRARDLRRQHYSVISVIGDGSFTGGMVYEALNNAADLKTNFMIVLNDNNMSISENVGGMSQYLARLRTSPTYNGLKSSVQQHLEKIPLVGEELVRRIRMTKSSIKQLVIPGMFFEEMGITYLGPVDGHNVQAMVRVFREARRVQGAVLIHVLTEKGRGYLPAMKDPELFHGLGPFDVQTGRPVGNRGKSYTDVFSETITELAREEPKLTAITAAMREGTGLKAFSELYPDRFFDTGIAEAHAVTFAAGLALGGQIPVVAVYSAFLQRAFDQIMDDVCMQKLHVIFAVDRAGLVGADGRTHQGCFDLSYLSMMPGMTVMAPKDASELREMLRFAVSFSGPVALRYPRGEAWEYRTQGSAGAAADPETGAPSENGKTSEKTEDRAYSNCPVTYGKAEILHSGSSGVALLAVGASVKTACEAAERLRKENCDPTIVNMRFIKPLDEELLRKLAEDHRCLITAEENVDCGGFGEAVRRFVSEENLPVRVLTAAVPDTYIRYGTVEGQRRRAGLDPEGLIRRIMEADV